MGEQFEQVATQRGVSEVRRQRREREAWELAHPGERMPVVYVDRGGMKATGYQDGDGRPLIVAARGAKYQWTAHCWYRESLAVAGGPS